MKASAVICAFVLVSTADAFLSVAPTLTSASRSYNLAQSRVAQSSLRTCNSIRMNEEVEEIEMMAEEKFIKSISVLKQNLATLRTGKASPSLLDRVMVEYYGAETPLNQLAGVSSPSGSSLTIDPYDKSCLADVEKAIVNSDLGLAPNNDGNVIRLNIPPMTEERRKEITKSAGSMGENAKVAIRNVRRDAIDSVKKLEKNKDIGEDESREAQDEIQKLTDKFVKEAADIAKKKEAEIMKV